MQPLIMRIRKSSVFVAVQSEKKKKSNVSLVRLCWYSENDHDEMIGWGR
jgi:hypothetical protein